MNAIPKLAGITINQIECDQYVTCIKGLARTEQRP